MKVDVDPIGWSFRCGCDDAQRRLAGLGPIKQVTDTLPLSGPM